MSILDILTKKRCLKIKFWMSFFMDMSILDIFRFMLLLLKIEINKLINKIKNNILLKIFS